MSLREDTTRFARNFKNPMPGTQRPILEQLMRHPIILFNSLEFMSLCLRTIQIIRKAYQPFH
jgi:hypothetical protein